MCVFFKPYAIIMRQNKTFTKRIKHFCKVDKKTLGFLNFAYMKLNVINGEINNGLYFDNVK